MFVVIVAETSLLKLSRKEKKTENYNYQYNLIIFENNDKIVPLAEHTHPSHPPAAP